MNLLKRFTDYISNEKLFTSEHLLIVAVSGGVDSIVLSDLCYQAGFRTELVHCNFRLRGEMSEADELFVRQFAESRNLPLQVKSFDTQLYSESKKLSIQVAARELRYGWFEELIRQSGGPAMARLLTAHHLDDNTETMLMNFFKGTGIAGLRGIRPLNGWLVRPLLFAQKQELVDYATINGLSWRNDHSNEENKYTRNFFRNQLIPMISSVFPEVEANMADNQRRFAGIEILYQEAVRMKLKKLMVVKNNEVHVPIRKLLLTPALETISWEIFRQYGFQSQAIPLILHLCQSESGKYISSSTHRVIRNRNWLVIAPLKQEEPGLIVIDEPGTYPYAGGVLVVTEESFGGQQVDLGTSAALADADEIKFPLLLRPWKAGDYFYPLGMKKKKKLARFLIDLKVSKTEKEKVWVIESQKKIIWVVRHRLDDRFRVTGSTSSVIRFA
ncbi:MAG: tRNA lysidine(34) synthetase TilS [Chitinophagaceae bacterium]